MDFTRTLEKGCEPGVDILYIKQLLWEIGMLDEEISFDTKDIFDSNLMKAVVNFHDRNWIFDNLDDLAKIDQKVWVMIQRTHAQLRYGMWQKPIINEAIIPKDEDIGVAFYFPRNISDKKATAIAESLGDISTVRRKIVMEALKHAYDPDVPRYYPLSVYIPGRTLYDKRDQEALNVVTPEMISEVVRRCHPFPVDKEKLMREAITLYPDAISGADDVGGIIGLCHFAKVCRPYTDATAKALATVRFSEEITLDELIPGDWAYKRNHVGLYVGGGYSVEWVGGHCGCQLTDIHGPRVIHNFSLNQRVELKPWEEYRRPLWY